MRRCSRAQHSKAAQQQARRTSRSVACWQRCHPAQAPVLVGGAAVVAEAMLKVAAPLLPLPAASARFLG